MKNIIVAVAVQRHISPSDNVYNPFSLSGLVDSTVAAIFSHNEISIRHRTFPCTSTFSFCLLMSFGSLSDDFRPFLMTNVCHL